MGRAQKRKDMREARRDAKQILAAYDMAKHNEAKRIALEAMRDAADYTRHHVLGQCFTALACTMLDRPYYWGPEKVSRLLDKISAILNDLDDGAICDADLIAHAEDRGIRIVWDANHKYVQEVTPYEREVIPDA